MESVTKNIANIVFHCIPIWISNSQDIESLVHKVIYAPCDLTIENDTITILQGDGLTIPLRMCSKEIKQSIYQLIHYTYHQKKSHLFKVNVTPKTFNIRYDKFKLNAILDQHLDRIELVKRIVTRYQSWFQGHSGANVICDRKIYSVLKHVAQQYELHNHPIQRGLYQLMNSFIVSHSQNQK